MSMSPEYIAGLMEQAMETLTAENPDVGSESIATAASIGVLTGLVSHAHVMLNVLHERLEQSKEALANLTAKVDAMEVADIELEDRVDAVEAQLPRGF